MGKAKKVKKVDHEDENDAEEVEVANETSINQIKEKKGKTKSQVEENESSLIEDEDDMQNKKKKGKKDRKKKGDDDEVDEDTDKLESSNKNSKAKLKKKVSVESDEENSSTEDGKSTRKNCTKKNKEKTAEVLDSDSDLVSEKRTSKSVKKPGFALLAVSDDEEEEETPEVETKDESENEALVERTKGNKKEKGDKKDKSGKKGKKKRKDDDEDEDLDQMLAELQIEYSGGVVQKEESVEKESDQIEEDEKDYKKEKKKKKMKSEKETIEEKVGLEAEETTCNEEGGTVKTAAQKKKEKKEKEKQKKLESKQKDVAVKKDSNEAPGSEEKSEPAEEKPEDNDDDDGDEDDKKKKKKKKKGDKDSKDKDKKGPGKKTLAAMKEALQKLKEEEERLQKEEEEKLRKLEEADKEKEEQLRLEKERKEKKKQKEKERKERLKAEGKLLTSKQKADRARAQATLEALKAQGLDVPETNAERKPRPGTRIRPKKTKLETQTSEEAAPETPVEGSEPKTVQVEIVDSVQEDVADKEEEDDVKDSWDLESSGEEDEEKSEDTSKPEKAAAVPAAAAPAAKEEEDSEEEEDESCSEEESSSEEETEDSSDDDDEEDEEEKKTDAQRKREKALLRIQKRKEEAEKKRTVDELRAAVVCVLGHVDTGKTKILDKLRRTNVQDGEAGGITQQIGATNVPIDAIKENTRYVKGFAEVELKVPGLLIIDTPGHESFSNLRNRGSSLCDIAILVVDIMHGLEPQTIESINLLKTKKTPFIVALNKIDRLYDWNTMARRDVRDIIKTQAPNTQLEFEQRTKEVVLQFAQQGLNAALFYDNPDPRSYVSLVPTSAITGEGMGNLLALIVQSCQTMLAKRLMFSEELQATVLEVKAIPGLGTTIDAILVNGYLREGETAILAGTDGPIVTQIRSLLMPQPMKELRVKNAYVEYKEIKAAQGVKIAAKDLEKAIAGLNLQVAQKPDEVEILRDEVAKELKHALSGIRLSERGVYVQASTLGSLEALLEFLRTSKIPYSNIRIGPVVKKDVMKASIMLEHESQYATILAFDVKVERDAQELADTLGVKIFQADIIYHLFDKFMAYREEIKQKKRDEFKNIAVFPCKLKILPQFVFNSRDPIVCGVMVEAGIVKEGTPICVPSKDFVELGIVTSIENNHKNVETARKGQEVCIKIEPIPGEAPKMFGRHFDEKDFLVSKISRQSIDACKDYFRDDLLKTDWQLMVELKKLFQIL